MRKLAGKVALITGAGSGIGRGMARAMAANGLRLALVDLNGASVEALAQELNALGASVLPVQMDVRDPTAWKATADEAEAKLGPVSILCSNAGVAGSRLTVEETEPEAWFWTFDINLHGSFHGIKTFLPRMRSRNEEAHIVVTSSLGGFLAHSGNAPYSAAKAALIAFCETLKAELSDTEIGVSVLCPGLVSTNLLRNNRILAPTSINHLCHDEPELQAQMKAALDPRQVGEWVIEGIRQNRFWLFTHPELRELVRARFDEILAAMS